MNIRSNGVLEDFVILVGLVINCVSWNLIDMVFNFLRRVLSSQFRLKSPIRRISLLSQAFRTTDTLSKNTSFSLGGLYNTTILKDIPGERIQ